mgnify:CR=1 FL=1|jgi:hypothetical protein
MQVVMSLTEVDSPHGAWPDLPTVWANAQEGSVFFIFRPA